MLEKAEKVDVIRVMEKNRLFLEYYRELKRGDTNMSYEQWELNRRLNKDDT